MSTSSREQNKSNFYPGKRPFDFLFLRLHLLFLQVQQTANQNLDSKSTFSKVNNAAKKHHRQQQQQTASAAFF